MTTIAILSITESIKLLKLKAMHNFKLGDRVSHPADSGPFEVVGLRKTTVEIKGDWSGGVQPQNSAAWVNYTEVKPYKEPLTQEYIDELIDKYQTNLGTIISIPFEERTERVKVMGEVYREIILDLRKESGLYH